MPPSWISDFRFHLGVLLLAPLKSLTPKTYSIGIELEISFLSIIQAEIHVFHERLSQAMRLLLLSE